MEGRCQSYHAFVFQFDDVLLQLRASRGQHLDVLLERQMDE